MKEKRIEDWYSSLTEEQKLSILIALAEELKPYIDKTKNED